MNPITVFLAITCAAIGAVLGVTGYFVPGAALLVVAIVIASALKMANTWQKFVILRAGKLRGVKGPGLFLIIPVIDNVVAVIDERIIGKPSIESPRPRHGTRRCPRTGVGHRTARRRSTPPEP